MAATAARWLLLACLVLDAFGDEVKNITASIGHNVTERCKGANDTIKTVKVSRDDEYVLVYRDGRVDPDVQDNVWLEGCNGLTDCHDLLITALIKNSTYYGTYKVEIKYKDKNTHICIFTVMPPPASGDLTASPTYETPTTETPTIKTPTAEAPTSRTPTTETPTTAMAPNVIAGITVPSVVLVLVLLVGGGVLLFIKWRNQTGDNPADQHQLQTLNGGPRREDNGNTSDGGPY